MFIKYCCFVLKMHQTQPTPTFLISFERNQIRWKKQNLILLERNIFHRSSLWTDWTDSDDSRSSSVLSTPPFDPSTNPSPRCCCCCSDSPTSAASQLTHTPTEGMPNPGSPAAIRLTVSTRALNETVSRVRSPVYGCTICLRYDGNKSNVLRGRNVIRGYVYACQHQLENIMMPKVKT